MKAKGYFILIILTICTWKSFAQKRIYVNEYLNIGVGGKGLSMSGAMVANTDDVYSPYWNPAGIVQNDAHYQVGLMHAEYFSGIFKYDYAAVIMPFDDNKRALGISFIRFATDNIPYTLEYLRPDGSFDESQLRSITAGDYAVTLSYAQDLGIVKDNENWEFTGGANLKTLYRHIGSMGRAWGIGLDLGIIAKYKKWNFGLSAKDITTTNTAWSFNLSEREKEIFRETGNEIPIKSFETMYPRLNSGLGRHWLNSEKDFNIYTELGFDITTDGRRQTIVQSNVLSLDPRFGLEANYKNIIYLRAGVQNFQRVLDNTDNENIKKYTVFQPSVGVGLNLKGLHIDYAFTSLQMQENPLLSHIVSLKLDINIQKRIDRKNEENKSE